MSRLAAALIMAVSLSGCLQWVVIAGSVLSGTNAVYQNVGLITGVLDKSIEVACQGWREKHALALGRIDAGGVGAAQAASVNDIAAYGEAVCNPANPPPAGDPLETVIWLAGLGGQVEALTAPKSSGVTQ